MDLEMLLVRRVRPASRKFAGMAPDRAARGTDSITKENKQMICEFL